MNFLAPAALTLSIILPLIALLYFMRPRRQERMVGSTMLWQQALQDLQASHPWQRLHITPLLLLQLLAAAIFVLILTRPAILTQSSLRGNTIIILQASASMQATDVSPTRFEHARNQISDFINSLGPGNSLALLTMAQTPQVLMAPSQDKGQLTAALQRAHVTNQDADLAQALSVASSLGTRQRNTQVLVVGDGHIMQADQTFASPFPVRYLRIGTDAPHAALLALAARTIQGKLLAFAQVANYSPQLRAIPVALYADGRLVNVQTALVEAGASLALQWTGIPASTHILHAHIAIQDVMSVDHDAWTTVGSPLRGHVLLVTRGNSFLQTALRLQPNVDLFETTPDRYKPSGAYDLTIFDDFAPAHVPEGALLFVNPPPGAYPFGTSGPETAIRRVSAVDDSVNFLKDVDLSSIHTLNKSHQLQPASWVQTVLAAPDTPLLIAGETKNRRIAALGCNLHDSDLPLQPAFPILIHNILNWFLPSPVTGGQVSTGAAVSIQSWPGSEQVTITSPDQHVTTVGPPFPTVPFAATDQTGIYTIAQRVRGTVLQGAFAVNLFNATQSRLAPAPTLPVAQSSAFSPSTKAPFQQVQEIWPWITVFLLLVLALEWWLFSSSYRQRASSSVSRAQPKSFPTSQRPVQRSLMMTLHQRLQSRYRTTKKRVLKAWRHSSSTALKKTPTRGKKRVHI